MENPLLTLTDLKTNNDYAQKYLEKGWSVLPMTFIQGDDGKMVKKPVVKWKEYQTTQATPELVKEWIDKGYFLGIITGKLSGIVIIDDDRIKHGLEPSTITSTVMAKTKSGGRHIYYKYDREIRNVANPNLFIDIRGEGGYCVLPPYNGYEWISPPSKKNLAELPTLPENILKEIQGDKKENVGTAIVLADYQVIKTGGRNDTMMKLSCSVWNNDKLSEPEKIDQITWLNDTRCKADNGDPNPLPQKELEVIINQAKKFVENNPKEEYAKPTEPVSPPKKLQTVIDERSEERKLEVDCPSTGFNTLDLMVKGFIPKHTYVLTGDTNVGKTSLACSFACNVALQGKRVLYLALEPDTGVVEYFASIIQNKRFDELDPNTDYSFGNLPIDVYTSEQIDSVDKLIKAIETTERYDLIIIDHIGYFITDKSNTNQEQSNVMKKLAGISKRNHTSVMAIAHIRKPDNRVKQRVPTMNDISGSGSFKQDGTDVWIVYKQPNPDDETHSTFLNEGSLIVAKSKSGRTGPIKIMFSDMKAGIREYEEFE